MDTRAWQATVRGVIKSQTQLQHLSNNTGMYVYVPVCGVHVRVCVCVCVCVRERERERERDRRGLIPESTHPEASPAIPATV